MFHLGALTRLNELGLLGRIDTISAVSGGSILAAHLATVLPAWPAPGQPVADWDARVAEPFRTLMRTNIRTWPVLKRLLPWNWFRTSTAARTLESLYEKYLSNLKLTDLSPPPRYVFCSTDMAFGVNWVFDSGGPNHKARLGDYRAGYLSPLPDWPLARAVAASSCFPPVFNPLPVDLSPAQLKAGAYQRPDRTKLVKSIRLSDGGVYDNMGLEPLWKDHQTILVSDGGAVFEAEPDTGLLWRMARYLAIAGKGGGDTRKRWLMSSIGSGEMQGTYWGIGSAQQYPNTPTGYSPDLVRDVISKVRTDLDTFSEAEIRVLENHGYLRANAVIQTYLSGLIGPMAPPALVPFPAWMNEDAVRIHLAKSHKRRKLERFQH